MTALGAWTADEVRETARSLRELAWGWEWPAAVLEVYDSPEEQQALRATREQSARIVDSYTRVAESLASEGQTSAAAEMLDNAARFWEGFEAMHRTLNRAASQPALTRVARYVYEESEDARQVLSEVAEGVRDAAAGAARGAGIGLAVVAVAAVMLLGRRR